ncbi:PAS domain-containing sensor histidine kinase [Tenacibaculum sp. SZ-18]|uniref:sensor histidine kinase n=1 Tax=Tenacibaculum sp. SZ-18 TaxID=754423 RepID=UPI000C2CE801|nr:PAS domain-containing sensor histidine kinase [Tenacibaculum sp. SZ-18]AUC15239.1 PAS domain-containing sensor histidine kinase [Tenacibaculum sp. SZ-18]
MSQEKIEILLRSLNREREARKAAEKILEDKSRELYFLSEELKQSNQQLENLLNEKSSQLKGVFENILDAYVIIDLSGNVLKFNDAAVDLFGYSTNGSPVNVVNLIYHEDLMYAMNSFDTLKEKGFFKNYKARVVTKSKAIKWVHINASIIHDITGLPIAAQGIVRDVTHLKFLEEQKEQILKKLEKSNNELYEYAHVVSHDLKSPLRTIDTLVSWIRSDNVEKFDEETIQNMNLIETTLENMDKLISNILNYSSADTANEEVEVELSKVISNIKNTLFIPENISLRINSKLPVLRGDGTKFQQLFQNLISNAIKFNNKKNGFIEIDFTEEVTFYQFSVKDNGIGIEKEFHDKIFKVFQSLTKREDSTGIGLSIVKKIVDLYKGTIWLESTPNVGTTFYFTIKK